MVTIAQAQSQLAQRLSDIGQFEEETRRLKARGGFVQQLRAGTPQQLKAQRQQIRRLKRQRTQTATVARKQAKILKSKISTALDRQQQAEKRQRLIQNALKDPHNFFRELSRADKKLVKAELERRSAIFAADIAGKRTQAIGSGIEEGTFLFRDVASPGGASLGRPIGTSEEGGLTIQSLDDPSKTFVGGGLRVERRTPSQSFQTLDEQPGRFERDVASQVIGSGIEEGTFLFRDVASPGGASLGRPIGTSEEGGLTIQSLDDPSKTFVGGGLRVERRTPSQSFQTLESKSPSTKKTAPQLTPFGIPSFKVSEIRTTGDFLSEQRQKFFEQESKARQQSPLIDARFEKEAKGFGWQKFRELSRGERFALHLGAFAIGSAKLGTDLVEFETPGFGGIIEPESFSGTPEQNLNRLIFGEEVKAFAPIRDKPGDPLQTIVGLVPLGLGLVGAVETFRREGVRGIGTLAKGFSPLKTQTFEEFSLASLQAQPTTTVGIELPRDPVTGGRQFGFTSGREVTPIFGRGGATQLQEFEVLEVPRPGKPSRAVIKGGEATTEFVDPITGRGIGDVQFFTGEIEPTRTGLSVRKDGKLVSNIEGTLGIGRLFRPGTSEFQEFPVGGVGRKVGKRFIGLDVEPTGFGLRTPKVTELTFEPGGRVSRKDVFRTDVDPTRFVRGKPTGRTDVFFTQEDVGIPSQDQGFTVFAPRGKAGRKGPTQDLFQTEIPKSLTGLSGTTKRVLTTLSLPKPTSTRPTAILSGPSAFSAIRKSPGAFTGLGLFERTSAVSGPIVRGGGRGGQTLIGTNLGTGGQTLVGPGVKFGGPRPSDLIFKPLISGKIGTDTFSQTSQGPKIIPTFDTAPKLADLQVQSPVLKQPPPPAIEVPQLSVFQEPVTRRPTPAIRRPTQRFRDPFFPIGFPTVLGGSGRRGRRTKRKGSRRVPIRPSFTASVLDLRGSLPTELSVGGFDLGVLPGQIRRIPGRKKKASKKIRVRKPTRKRVTKKRR